MLTKNQIEENEKTIISLLRSTQREGIETVINYLRKGNFFQIPSSLNRHHNWRGGLAQHCLGVYQIAAKQAEGLPSDSVIIAALLHDVCKIGLLAYNPVKRMLERRKPRHIPGHGRRSCKLLKTVCHLKLTEEERRAIRWHMGGHHAQGEERKDVELAYQSKLWQIVHDADRKDAARGKPLARPCY